MLLHHCRLTRRFGYLIRWVKVMTNKAAAGSIKLTDGFIFGHSFILHRIGRVVYGLFREAAML